MPPTSPHPEYTELHAHTVARRADAVRDWAIGYLRAVLAGERENRAIRHPLGFVCFPAVREAGHGVCLHVWTSGATPTSTTSAIHAHSWDLLSTVLYGAVGNDVVEIDRDTGAPTHRICDIHSGRDGDTVRRTDRTVAYRRSSREVFRRGDVYELPHGVFHVSEVEGDAATVALGRDRPDRIDRSLAPLDVRDHRVHRTSCTPEETRRVARLVLDRLLGDTPDPKHWEDRWQRAQR